MFGFRDLSSVKISILGAIFGSFFVDLGVKINFGQQIAVSADDFDYTIVGGFLGSS